MSGVRTSARTSWLLLLISLVTLVGHVCALPAHGEPRAEPAGHQHGQPAAPQDGHDDADTVHAASCDAVRTTAPTIAAPALTAGHVAGQSEMRPLTRPFVRRTVAPAMPPLFLLHAALLI
jgi:hypothetical protein